MSSLLTEVSPVIEQWKFLFIFRPGTLLYCTVLYAVSEPSGDLSLGWPSEWCPTLL